MSRKITKREVSESMAAYSKYNPEQSIRESITDGTSVGEIYNIRIDDITPFKNQSRRVFDNEELLKMANTIEKYGIRQPLTVIAAEEQGKYQVVSGERRLRAAKIAGLTKVPAIVLSEVSKANAIALIENIHRSDLHPVEYAEALQHVKESEGITTNIELADLLSVSNSKITEAFDLLKLPDSIQSKLIKEGIVSRVLLRRVCKASTENEMHRLLDDSKNGVGEKPSRASSVAKRPISCRSLNGKFIVNLVNSDLTQSQKQSLIIDLKDILAQLES